MQNYFNDSLQVLVTTERLLNNEILANQTILIENPKFFDLTGYSPFEVASNLFEEIEGEDEPQPKEIYEWWLVTEWLAKKLNSIEQVVLETDWGFYWGRTCTGQAIELDNVMQEVARLIHGEKRQIS